MAPTTYYDTLQVARTASPSVIKAAYRALSQRHHPDKNLGRVQSAHENMRRLNEAYAVLSDANRRAIYDARLNHVAAPTVSAAPKPAPQPSPRPTEARQTSSGSPRPAASSSSASDERTKDQSPKRDFSGGYRQSSETVAQRGYSPSEDKRARSNAWTGVMYMGGLLGIVLVFAMRAGTTTTSTASSPSVAAIPVGRGALGTKSAQAAEATSDAVAGATRARSGLELTATKIETIRQGGSSAPLSSIEIRALAVASLPPFHAENPQNAIRADARVPEVPSGKETPEPASSDVLVGQLALASDASIVANAGPIKRTFVRQPDLICLSSVTLDLRSSNGGDLIQAELRRGARPGSALLDRATVRAPGIVMISNVCPGTYFFAFAGGDSNVMHTTRYFDVERDEAGYSNPRITVYYSRAQGAESQRVGSARRDQL